MEIVSNFEELATLEVLNKVTEALNNNGFTAQVFESKEDVLEHIKTFIPAGSTLMNGSSVTLESIGLVDYLKEGKHEWKNLHEEILKETDPIKQNALRRACVVSDYYLGSAHAVTENGEIMIASGSGSQLSHLIYTSENVILVVGAQKITENLEAARIRLTEYVYPLEDKRMASIGWGGSTLAQELILHKHLPLGRNFYVYIVNESLGF